MVKRYLAEGPAGLHDRSSRPHRLYRPTPEPVVARICALRRQRRTGKEIAAQAGVSPATVSRILKRTGLTKLKSLEPPVPVRRYERDHPGELIHIDIKQLGRFERVGHRITGNRQLGESRGAGFEFVHVAIDDASRLAFSQILPDQKKESAIAFLTALIAYYASLGVTVTRVMTDNGSCYRAKEFRNACRDLGLKHITTRPYTPGPTARPSASSRPRSANGPMPRPIRPRTTGPPNCRPGSTDTTGIARTAAYNPNRQSAASASPRTTC